MCGRYILKADVEAFIRFYGCDPRNEFSETKIDPFRGLDLFEPQTGVRWGTSGLRLQARPHADVEVRVIDAEKRTPIERFAVMWPSRGAWRA